MSLPRNYLLIGTAGHIDHGKTRLVARLTGIDTDRLPEEKSRGISIDLGFAHWDCGDYRFGIVDVPGHERFVKNMVAGATGVNLALLVIAADDGVMPQTREHLEIMQLLGIQTGLVVITKIDLVEEDFVELVRAEIEDVVADTFLEGRPVVAVSSATGEGFEQLELAILQVADEVQMEHRHSAFRMPVDRVFSIRGHGTVVTGSVLSGSVATGDVLELLPQPRSVRVRGVETHGVQTEDSSAGRRTAVNLAGVKAEEVERGHELATAGVWFPSQRLIVRLQALASSRLFLKNRMEFNLHLGTQEIVARLILKRDKLGPGESGYADLRLQQPAVAAQGQRFILRCISPPLTIAGGEVLDPGFPQTKRIKDVDVQAGKLDQSSAAERFAWLCSQYDAIDEDLREISWRSGLDAEEAAAVLESLTAAGSISRLGMPPHVFRIHTDRLMQLAKSVLRTIGEELTRQQPRRALPRNTLLTACREISRPAVLDAVLDHLINTKQLVAIGDQLGPADLQVKLSKAQHKLRDNLLAVVTEKGLSPPSTKELAESQSASLAQVMTLLNLCVEDGLLLKVSDSLFFAPASIDRARQTCQQVFADGSTATLSELREAWNTSRKYAIPLGEYFDEHGLTERDGDVRRAGANLAKSVT